MKKVEFVGWMGKQTDLKIEIPGDDCTSIEIPAIYTKKSKRTHWLNADWPPRKVRVVIEEVE